MSATATVFASVAAGDPVSAAALAHEYVIATGGRIRVGGASYTSPDLLDRVGGTVRIAPHPEPGKLTVRNWAGIRICDVTRISTQHSAPGTQDSPTPPAMQRLAGHLLHARTFTVQPLGILIIAGQWYTGPGLDKRVGSRVRAAVIPNNAHAIAVLDLPGRMLCEAELMPGKPIDLAHLEYAYALEATDKLIDTLRQLLASAIGRRNDTQRRVQTIVANLSGHNAPAEPEAAHGAADPDPAGPVELPTMSFTGVYLDNGKDYTLDPHSSQLPDSERVCRCDQIRASMADGCHNPEGMEECRASVGHYPGCPMMQTLAQASASHAERLAEDATQPGPEYDT